MAADRSPSGLPGGRIVRPMYGASEVDLDRRVGNQHEGFLRVRRSLSIVAIVLVAVIALVLVFGSAASAAGMAMILLAPLLVILAGTHLAAVITEPKQRNS